MQGDWELTVEGPDYGESQIQRGQGSERAGSVGLTETDDPELAEPLSNDVGNIPIDYIL